MNNDQNSSSADHPKIPISAGARATRIHYPENPRYRRVRFLSSLLDQSIVLPTGYRIGLDPILGLIPGIGDAIGATISSYIVYECARLGVPKMILGRMLGNIAIEALAGTIPVLGDLFDAAWKANMRNLRLLDAHYHPALPERPANRVVIGMAVGLGLFLIGIAALGIFFLRLVLSLFGS